MQRNNRKIHVIGFNSFEFEDLSLKTQKLFRDIKNIAVPESFSNEIREWISNEDIKIKNFYISKSNINLIKWIRSLNDEVILISRGDPLWYGIGRILTKNFSQEELIFYPANTCIQLAFSKLKKPWQGVQVISIHGRDSIELTKLLKLKEKSIAILTDPKKNSLFLIRKNLKELGLENVYEFWLCEEVGLKKEKITLILSDEILPNYISDLNIVILLKKEIIHSKTSLPLFGIDDNYFKTFNDRPNLITKREIRVQILANLELPETGTLLDIGAGCGTIGLEALRIRPKIDLICIDKRLGSQALIKENAKRLNVRPKTIIEGDVMQYFVDGSKEYQINLKRIIIGGCDKNTKILVINELNKFLSKGDVIVLPLITYEILQELNLLFIKLNYETIINLVQTYKGLSIIEGTRFEPNNPVFLIKAKKS